MFTGLCSLDKILKVGVTKVIVIIVSEIQSTQDFSAVCLIEQCIDAVQ